MSAQNLSYQRNLRNEKRKGVIAVAYKMQSPILQEKKLSFAAA